MRLVIARALVLSGALGLAAGAAADEGRKTGYSDTVTVVAVREGERAVLVREDTGGERVIHTDEGTRILEGAATKPLASLQTGQRVVVDATSESPAGTGRLVADRIVLVQEQGEPTPDDERPRAPATPGGPANEAPPS